MESKVFYYAGKGDYDAILREVSATGNSKLLTLADSSTQQTVLHFAAEANALEFLYFVIGRYAKDVDIDVLDSLGWSPLLCAAKAGALAVCNILVQKGANPGLRTRDESSVLHYVVRKPVPEADRELVSRFVDVVLERAPDLRERSLNSNGESPLHLAALNGNEFLLRLLVERGFDIGVRARNGQTVLHMAVCSGSEDLVSYVLDCDVDKAVAGADGQTAAQLAVRLGLPALAEIIERHKPLAAMTPTELVWRAVKRNKRADLPALLANPNVDVASIAPFAAVGEERQSMLLYFAVHGFVNEMAALMLHPSFMSYDKSAISMAIKALITHADAADALMVRYLAVLESLIDVARINPNVPFDASRDNVLFVAVRAGNFVAVSLLLSARRWGVEVDRKHPVTGETPLVLAVKMSSPKCVQLLLEFGASIEQAVGGVPLDSFAQGECQALVRTFRSQLLAILPLVVRSKDTLSLNLCGLKLTRLPFIVYRLTYLRELDLSENRLRELEPMIAQLVNLRSLKLDDNNLDRLPTELGHLAHLSELSIKLNPRLNVHLRRLSEISCYRVMQYLRLCEEGVVSQEEVSPSNSDDEDETESMFANMHAEDENLSQVSVLKSMLAGLQRRELKLRDLNVELQLERAALDISWEKLREERGAAVCAAVPRHAQRE